MNLIDTHSHLFDVKFDNDRQEVIERALKCGVQKIILPNINLSTINPMMQICDEFPKNCFPMIGLHPCDIKPNYKEELILIEKLLDIHKPIAIGEIGIDLYWDKTNLKIQKEAFKMQIKLAKKHKLPIAIHVRESFNEVFEVLDELNDENLSGVFHCFTGDLKQAEHIIKYKNFMLGIGGVITFKNSHMNTILQHISLEHIVLETDSPYLAPEPKRGRRNESSYIIFIATKLAEIYNSTTEEIAITTTRNAKNIFNI